MTACEVQHSYGGLPDKGRSTKQDYFLQVLKAKAPCSIFKRRPGPTEDSALYIK